MNKKIPIELAVGVIILIALSLGSYFWLQGQKNHVSNYSKENNQKSEEINNNTCNSDEDCIVRTTYNCCGIYPKCLSKNAAIESQEAVNQKCKQLRTASICGFPVVESCKCENNQCVANNTQKEKTEMANPASVYCQENGGKLEIRTAQNGGQSGFCKFEDGSECEEWAFMRGECKKDVVQSEADVSSWKTYKNEKYGFEFQYPIIFNLEEDSKYAELWQKELAILFSNSAGHFWLTIENNPENLDASGIKENYYNNESYGYQYEDSFPIIAGIKSYKQSRYDLGVIEKYYIPRKNTIIGLEFEFNFKIPDENLLQEKKDIINNVLTTLKFTK